MTLNRAAARMLIAVPLALLALIYLAAWMAPAVGLIHQDADYLVAAIAGGSATFTAPPLFPALLALFVAISRKVLWLKLLPLLCTFGWLVLTWKLLRRMGASRRSASAVVALTAASPTVIFLGTHLLPETLFALLLTAALIALLAERPIAAGLYAALATLTIGSGVALIAACIITFVVRARFRNAIRFAASSMVLVAPWLGWSLAHAAPEGHSLAANEKLIVLGHNLINLLEAPFSLLTGITSLYAAVILIPIAAWCLIRRRQLIPDLLLGIYSLVLLCSISPPEIPFAAVLPLLLWIFWRVLRNAQPAEAVLAAVSILLALTAWADAKRLPATFTQGEFSAADEPADDWRQMKALFTFIRSSTPADAVLLANLDSAFYLNTGRRTLPSATLPGELSRTIFANGVRFVALTPDVGLAESPAFHRAVEALERAGILVPVPVPGLSPGYRLLTTASVRLPG